MHVSLCRPLPLPAKFESHGSTNPAHLSHLNCRMILNASYRNSPPYCDVAAVREVGGAGGELWRLTKSHVAYERKRAEYEGLVQKQRALLEGLVPCLQLLLPGARSGESGAAGGAPPPTKAARVSCSVQ